MTIRRCGKRRGDGTPQMEKLRAALIDWGWQITRICRDDRGVFTIRASPSADVSLYCITKDEPYKGRASFPLRVVERAHDYDSYLAIFFGDEPRLGEAYVFNAGTVKYTGDVNLQDVSYERREQWVDISLDAGCLLGDLLAGHHQPSPPTNL